MIATFVEGVGEVVLPCSLGMLLPGLAAVLLGWRRSLAGFVVFAATAAIVAWARAADLLSIEADAALAAAVAAGVAAAWMARGSLVGPAGAGLFFGVFAGSTWQPCVGERLGEILNGARQSPSAQLVPMIVYVAGLTLVLGAFALTPVVWPRLRIAKPIVGPVLGTVIAAVLAVGTVTGLYDRLLSELAQLTTR